MTLAAQLRRDALIRLAGRSVKKPRLRRKPWFVHSRRAAIALHESARVVLGLLFGEPIHCATIVPLRHRTGAISLGQIMSRRHYEFRADPRTGRPITDERRAIENTRLLCMA